MTKEEAIERLNKIALNYGLSSDKIEALTLAIQSLEAQGREVKSAEDYLKDKGDVDIIIQMHTNGTKKCLSDFMTEYCLYYTSQFPSVKQCGCMTHCNCPILTNK